MPSLLQAALAQQILANQSLQAAFSASQDKRQAAVVSVRRFLNPLVSLQSWMLTCSCALQARLESECKAHEAVLAEVQQKCKNEAEVSWPPAVHSAFSKLCYLCKLLQHCQRMLLSAIRLVQC